MKNLKDLQTWWKKWRTSAKRARAAKAGEFQIRQREDGDWGWAYVARNGEKVFYGEGYTRPADARRSIANVRKAVDAPIRTIQPAKADKSPATGP